MNGPGWRGQLKYLHAPMGFHVGAVDRRFAERIRGERRVLNIGSKKTGEAGWINMDIVPHSDRINLMGDAHFLPFRSGSLDAVVMKFVLEHVPDPAAVVGEVFRALRPGGRFFAAVPFVEPFHPDPGDYQRYSLDGFKRLCRDFSVEEGGVYYGPASALVEVLREFAAAFFDTPVLKKGARFAAGWAFWPVKFLDVYLGRKKHAHICAYGIYLLLKKP